LDKLDELIKARFVELFGDVKENPNHYPVVYIKEVVSSCEAGWSGNGTQREKKDGEVAVLKVSAVTKGYFIPDECKVLDDQENIKKRVIPEKGDLIFSRANTREMVGATAIVMKDYPELILPDKLWKIRFNNISDVYYMKHVLSSKHIRDQFSAQSTGTSGSMFNVSMEKFYGISIPLPPVEKQVEFRNFVEQVDKSKVAVQKSLDETQKLFDSLMQEYFG
jgi:type I restriction enzyme S subunit